MPYELSISDDSSYIKIRRWGVVSESELKNALDEIIEIANKDHINHVLINGHDIESFPDSPQLFQFGEAISQSFGPLRLWFAVIFGDKSKEDLKFLESVIHNRAKNAAIFADEESAIQWLKSRK